MDNNTNNQNNNQNPQRRRRIDWTVVIVLVIMLILGGILISNLTKTSYKDIGYNELIQIVSGKYENNKSPFSGEHASTDEIIITYSSLEAQPLNSTNSGNLNIKGKIVVS